MMDPDTLRAVLAGEARPPRPTAERIASVQKQRRSQARRWRIRGHRQNLHGHHRTARRQSEEGLPRAAILPDAKQK